MRTLFFTLFLFTGCSDLVTTDQVYNKKVPLMFFVKPSPYLDSYNQVVVISSADKLPGTIHISLDEKRPRYREVVNGILVFNTGKVSIENMSKDIVFFSERDYDLRYVGIDSLSYPTVYLNSTPFNYQEFLSDYGYSPPYSVGDSVWVVTVNNKLEAIF